MNQFKFAISSKFFACLTIWTIFQTNNIHAQEIPRLNIGVIMPLSGPQKAYGDEAMRGIDIAIDHFALSNPKVAAKIRLSKFDDKSQSKVAGELAEKLYGKKRTHIIIGSISTPSTQEIGIGAAKHKRPLISPLATSDELIKKGYVYRTSLDRDLQAQLLGEFALLKLKLKKAAILRDDSDLSKSFSARFSKSFKSRVSKIVATEIYSAGTTDFRIHLNKIKSSNAETVLLPAYTSTAGTIMQQAKEIGLKVKFLGTDSWDTSTLNQAAAGGGSGHYFTAQYAVSPTLPLQKEFIRSFRAKFGRSPGALAALTYDSYFLAVDALQRARSTLYSPLNRAFQRTAGFEGVTGLLSFNKDGGTLKSAFIKKTNSNSAKLHSIVTPTGIQTRKSAK